MLVGFHGYAEDAEAQLERLRAIPESTRWLSVSIQALHRVLPAAHKPGGRQLDDAAGS